MAQHLCTGEHALLSVGPGGVRLCEVCLVWQFHAERDWEPLVSPICSGNPDEGAGRRPSRGRPNAPSGTPIRVLEDAGRARSWALEGRLQPSRRCSPTSPAGKQPTAAKAGV
jgi:hypothetical protein